MIFDVIIPTCGRPSLQRAIESVLTQTHQDFVLHIIWHNNPVGTGLMQEHRDSPSQFLEAASVRHDIRKYHLKNDQVDSGTSARNFGIAQGSSDWVAYLDDDDYWLPEHLEYMAAEAANDPAVNMMHSWGHAFRMSLQTGRSLKRTPRYLGSTVELPLTVSMGHTRELFCRTDGWQPHDNHDHALWNSMVEAGGKAAIIKVITYHFLRGKR